MLEGGGGGDGPFPHVSGVAGGEELADDAAWTRGEPLSDGLRGEAYNVSAKRGWEKTMVEESADAGVLLLVLGEVRWRLGVDMTLLRGECRGERRGEKRPRGEFPLGPPLCAPTAAARSVVQQQEVGRSASACR